MASPLPTVSSGDEKYGQISSNQSESIKIWRNPSKFEASLEMATRVSFVCDWLEFEQLLVVESGIAGRVEGTST